MMCSYSSYMAVWSKFEVCEWRIDQSPTLGMTEMNRDDSYCNISISLNSKYVETRATKTPAFWEYPTPPHDYPYYQFISDPFHSKSKLRCAWGIITKTMNVALLGTYAKGYSNYYICIKFKSFSVKMASGMRKKSKSLIRSLCAYQWGTMTNVIPDRPSPLGLFPY